MNDFSHIVQEAAYAEVREPLLIPSELFLQQEAHNGDIQGMLESIPMRVS